MSPRSLVTARRPVAAGRQAAAGAAHSDADPVVLAEGRAGRPLRQLAAGSVANYLARLVFPGRPITSGYRRSRRRDSATPVRLLSSNRPAERHPSATRLAASRSGALISPARRCAEAEEFLRTVDVAEQRTIDFLVALNQRLQGEIRYLIRMEPGVQTPEDARTGAGSCRDTGGCWWQVLRHLGRGALRLRLPDPAQADVKALDGPLARTTTSPTCMPWWSLSARGRVIGLDRPRGCWRRGHIRWPAPRIRCVGRRRSARRRPECEVAFSHAMKVTRVFESAARDPAYTDEQWAGSSPWGGRSRGLRAPTSPGPWRRATSCRSTDPTAPSGTPRRWPTKRGFATETWCSGCARSTARGGFPALRPGQVVSRRAAARWHCRSSGVPTGTVAGTMRRDFADERHPPSATDADGRRFIECSPGAWPGDEVHPDRLRDAGLPVARAPAAVNVRSFESKLDDELGTGAAAPALRPGARPGSRLRAAAGAAIPTESEGSRLGQRPWYFREPTDVPRPRRLADGYRLPSIRCPGWPRRTIPTCTSTTRSRHARHCRCTPTSCPYARTRRRSSPRRAGGMQAGFEGRPGGDPALRPHWEGSGRPFRHAAPGRRGLRPRRAADTPAVPARRDRRTGLSAPRCASKCATACCTSSCRRWPRSPIPSICSVPWKAPRPSSTSRWCSKATRRRAIHG